MSEAELREQVYNLELQLRILEKITGYYNCKGCQKPHKYAYSKHGYCGNGCPGLMCLECNEHKCE